jgi:hypothetical protein
MVSRCVPIVIATVAANLLPFGGGGGKVAAWVRLVRVAIGHFIYPPLL